MQEEFNKLRERVQVTSPGGLMWLSVDQGPGKAPARLGVRRVRGSEQIEVESAMVGIAPHAIGLRRVHLVVRLALMQAENLVDPESGRPVPVVRSVDAGAMRLGPMAPTEVFDALGPGTVEEVFALATASLTDLQLGNSGPLPVGSIGGGVNSPAGV